MDANEYARKMTPSPKALEVVLRNAQWLGKGAPKTSPVIALPSAPSPLSSTSTGEKQADGPAKPEAVTTS